MLSTFTSFSINSSKSRSAGKNVPTPPYPQSTYITKVTFESYSIHKGDGDMWPLTWAADNHLYGGAGDNMGSPMNFWRIKGDPPMHYIFHLDNLPVDHKKYCKIPPCDKNLGIKPAGLLSIDGTLYFAVEGQNFGDNPKFMRQHNIHGWIITSTDFGKTWNREATPTDFFTGRLCSAHFLQFGKDYAGARDEYVYAYFPAADDGQSYWDNGDYLLLGRVPKDKILQRDAWEFCIDPSKSSWSGDDSQAQPVFRYPLMTGEDHVSYNPGIKRYLLGNYSFMDESGNPCPYHQKVPRPRYPSQLTLYEAPEPWGPWSLFHRDDMWGAFGAYQPSFPTKWMSDSGKTLCMAYSGSYDDYSFTTRQMTLEIAD